MVIGVLQLSDDGKTLLGGMEQICEKSCYSRFCDEDRMECLSRLYLS